MVAVVKAVAVATASCLRMPVALAELEEALKVGFAELLAAGRFRWRGGEVGVS